MGKVEFKNFVKANPKLLKYVQSGNKSWQDFYEMYDMYGDDYGIWKDYLEEDVNVLDFIKNIDFDSIQNGVNSVQRVISLFQDMLDNKDDKEEAKPRPVYKHFED